MTRWNAIEKETQVNVLIQFAVEGGLIGMEEVSKMNLAEKVEWLRKTKSNKLNKN